MTDARIGALLEDLLQRLRGYRYLATTEHQLQDQVARALACENAMFERERPCGGGRIDFYLPAYCTGIELKTKGSQVDVVRQLQRYAEDDAIKAIVLATTRARLFFGMPRTVAGVPLHVLPLTGGLL